MIYTKELVINNEVADQIDKYLHIEPQNASECLGEDDTFTRTAVFENGIEMDIKCCGVQYQEGESNLAWTEAVLFKNGQEVTYSEVFDEYFREWILEDKEDVYIVKVKREKESEE